MWSTSGLRFGISTRANRAESLVSGEIFWSFLVAAFVSAIEE